MQANGDDIRTYPLDRTPVYIEYSLYFEAERARVQAGLSLAEFNALPGSPEWCTDASPVSKCDLIAFMRLDQLVNLVMQDAALKKAKSHA